MTIPADIPSEQVLCTANRHISTAQVTNITHVVYIPADSYDRLQTLDELKEVGRTVGRLNSILPKRQFILVGPGRWGSRGDIKLGVSVGYSDISNTAALVEVAWRRGSYVPDLSFGTHFFQDLVEDGIAYLPLYPDDPGAIFNERILLESPNLLAEFLPDCVALAGVVRVVDVRQNSGGRVMELLADGERSEAVIRLTLAADQRPPQKSAEEEPSRRQADDHWRWRQAMVERIAQEMDAGALGVQALYLFGSTKNASAGPCSDIDLLIHFNGSEQQRQILLAWLDGWSLSLAEMNYLRTGRRTEGLLDIHLVTDRDLAARTSWALRIGAVTDAARPIPLACRLVSPADSAPQSR